MIYRCIFKEHHNMKTIYETSMKIQNTKEKLDLLTGEISKDLSIKQMNLHASEQ